MSDFLLTVWLFFLIACCALGMGMFIDWLGKKLDNDLKDLEK